MERCLCPSRENLSLAMSAIFLVCSLGAATTQAEPPADELDEQFSALVMTDITTYPPELAICAALRDDGTMIAVSDWRRRVLVWDTLTGEKQCEITLVPSVGFPVRLGFTPQGDRLVVGKATGGFLVYEIPSGQLVKETNGVSVAIDLQTDLVTPGVGSSKSGFEWLLRTPTQDLLVVPVNVGAKEQYPGFVCSPDGSRLWMAAGFSLDTKFRVLEYGLANESISFLTWDQPLFPGQNVWCEAATMNRDGTFLLVVGDLNGFALFHMPDQKVVRNGYIMGAASPRTAIALSRDGLAAAFSLRGVEDTTVGSILRTAWLWTASIDVEVRTPDSSGITSLVYGKNELFLFVGTTSGRVLCVDPIGRKMEDADDGSAPNEPSSEVTPTLLAISKDDRRVVAAYLSRYNRKVTVRHWNIYGGDRLASEVILSIPDHWADATPPKAPESPSPAGEEQSKQGEEVPDSPK